MSSRSSSLSAVDAWLFSSSHLTQHHHWWQATLMVLSHWIWHGTAQCIAVPHSATWPLSPLSYLNFSCPLSYRYKFNRQVLVLQNPPHFSGGKKTESLQWHLWVFSPRPITEKGKSFFSSPAAVWQIRSPWNFVWISYVGLKTCRTIQLFSPSGATFPDSSASFSYPVAVTMVARSTVLPYNWTSMRAYYWLWLIRSSGYTGNVVVLRVACTKWWSHLFVEVAWIQ